MTYTYGQNITREEPIDGIPPIFGYFGLHSAFSRIDIESFIRFSTKQNRLSADDKDDLRIPPGGSPGWYTVNLRGQFNLSPDIKCTVALENIRDYNYRVHGSGINAPGRNLIVSIVLHR